MTATPRYVESWVRRRAKDADIEVASIDDPDAFGPVLHRLTLGDAIERDLLSDYQVAIVGVDDETARQYAERGTFVTTGDGEVTDARTLAAQIGVARAMRKCDLRRIQAIGRLDTRLREIEADVDRFDETPSESATLDLTEYLDQSRLWVLDAYELIRTLDACVSAELWSLLPGLAASLREIKRLLAQVRIPLTKFEPAGQGGRAVPGDLIAEPVLVQGVGGGWNIGDTKPVIVTRAGLSDVVLEFLEAVREANLRLRVPNSPTGHE